jgi:hypothetical protein
MKKNATKKTNKSNKNTATPSAAKASKAGTPGRPGRPLYVPKFPRKAEWTTNDFCVANDVDPVTGKNTNPKGTKKGCSKLTLIKWLARDKARKGRSLVKRLDHTAPPNSENGLGRKAFLFSLREKLNPDTAPATPVVIPSVTDDLSPEISDYEAQKAALLGTSTPVVDITPAPEKMPEEVPVAPEPEEVPVS